MSYLSEKDILDISSTVSIFSIASVKEDKIVGSSPRTVQRALKRLMDKGKIEHIGSNRFGHYIVK